MISVGESTGALDSMLGKIADFYDEEVDAAVGALTSMIEPMMMVFLGGTTPVLTYQISNMVTSLGAGWHLLTAAAFISMLMPMIIFFALQRFFVRGILAGSVKG